MTYRLRQLLTAAVSVLIGIGLAVTPAAAQTDDFPRTWDGGPDLNGIWQAIGTAHWDITGGRAASLRRIIRHRHAARRRGPDRAGPAQIGEARSRGVSASAIYALPDAVQLRRCAQ